MAIPCGQQELDGPIAGALLCAFCQRGDPIGGRELGPERARNVRELVPGPHVATVHAGHNLAGTIRRRSEVLQLSLELAQTAIGDGRRG
jgi:hypothetical protein